MSYQGVAAWIQDTSHFANRPKRGSMAVYSSGGTGKLLVDAVDLIGDLGVTTAKQPRCMLGCYYRLRSRPQRNLNMQEVAAAREWCAD